MGAKTEISWTDATWSPLRVRVKQDASQIARQKGYASLVSIADKMAGHVGPHCERVSEGCSNCYSETNNGRCLPANGTGLPFDRRSRDLVDVFVDEKILTVPLRWSKPRRIFVENQSDLFGEWVSDELIDKVFAVMALCQQHTFQCLTKRPIRALNYLCDPRRFDEIRKAMALMSRDVMPEVDWPLENVWLGVSVEDQKTADDRIPMLLKAPAAVRFVSYEPALGSVDFSSLPSVSGIGLYLDSLSNAGVDRSADISTKLDWIIVGGESGPGARPFDVRWANHVIQQCRAAKVPCFIKQLGSLPTIPACRQHHFDWNNAPDYKIFETWKSDPSGETWRIKLKDRKGGDPNEWADYLRVREFPNG